MLQFEIAFAIIESRYTGGAKWQILNHKETCYNKLKKGRAQAGQKTALKTAIKNVKLAVASNDKAVAAEALNKANKMLDSAVANNLKHKNYAARKISFSKSC